MTDKKVREVELLAAKIISEIRRRELNAVEAERKRFARRQKGPKARLSAEIPQIALRAERAAEQ